MKIVINGAASADELPGFEPANCAADVCYAPDEAALATHLPGADVLLGWNFRGRDLQNCWHRADALKWIHWCGAGVDAVLFPELISSPVVLSNSRGLFDRAMAEYVLGYMLFELKEFRGSIQAHQAQTWAYRMTRRLHGQRAAVFGVGSIGREVAGLLRAVGVEVVGVGRSEREDAQLGRVRSVADARQVAAEVDWVIAVMPSTPESDGLFDAQFFAAMRRDARFVNIGRGSAQDEQALNQALADGVIAGAMVDVFRQEPLPPDSPLWTAPNLFLSPHISGDYLEFQADMVTLFLDNLARYEAGDDLLNVVDKQLGFVPN